MHLSALPKKLSQNGFTLVEILIAISILSVVSAITIPNFNAFINDQNLRQSQEALKNGLRDAQNRAISGVDSNTVCSAPNNCNYWVLWFNDGDTSYRVSRVYTALPNGATCNALSTTDVISEKLQGGGNLQTPSNQRSCIFFRMINADPVFVNTFSYTGSDSYPYNTACIRLGNSWLSVDMNTAGLVRGMSSQGPCN